MIDQPTMFCTFGASGRLFGIPLADIKEITDDVTCTRIPHAPFGVRGYVNIRGQIILGLDLKQLLELPVANAEDARRLVIFKPAIGQAFGLFVDHVGEIVSVPSSDLDAGESAKLGLSSNGRGGLIERVVRLPEQLLVVLNPRKFLPIVEIESQSTNT